MDLPPLPAPQYVEVSKLKVFSRNPQTITEKEFAKLCKSVRDNPDYFAVRPCLVNSASGELIVYAGNKRLLAAIQEGYDKVPCMVENLTPAQQRERTVRDNVQFGEFDMDILAADYEIEELEEWGVDMGEILEPTGRSGGEGGAGERPTINRCPKCGHEWQA
jgi:ParB-like chromosome segregation protein Spo0J